MLTRARPRRGEAPPRERTRDGGPPPGATTFKGPLRGSARGTVPPQPDAAVGLRQLTRARPVHSGAACEACSNRSRREPRQRCRTARLPAYGTPSRAGARACR
eukprot:scaffold2991_cov403-Prasinococcus_capsulatus_cf.AAC.16